MLSVEKAENKQATKYYYNIGDWDQDGRHPEENNVEGC